MEIEHSTLCGITTYSPYIFIPKVWQWKSGLQRIDTELGVLPEMDQNEKHFSNKGSRKRPVVWRDKKGKRELEMIEVMFQSLVGNIEW